MCERVRSRPGSTARLRVPSAEPSTWPQASRSVISRPDNGVALVSTGWTTGNLDLADLSPPAEHAYGTGGVSQVGLLLIPIPDNPSPWLTRCRSPAGPRWPETKGVATQELRRGGLLSRMVRLLALDLSAPVGRGWLEPLVAAFVNSNYEAAWADFRFIGRVGAINV